MKQFLPILALTAVYAFAGDAVVPSTPTPAPALKLSELEIEKFKRMSLQINALRLQYEMNVQPVINEQQALIDKVCGAAKLAKEDCTINPDAGTVTKAVKPAAAPVEKK